MRPKRAMCLAWIVLMGCSVGPNPTTMGPATSPTGTRTTVVVQSGRAEDSVSGELIAVRGSDMLLLTSRGLSRVANEFIRSATFTDARPDDIRGPGTERERASLAQYSRYPFGLEGEALARLLRALGQDALIELGR